MHSTVTFVHSADARHRPPRVRVAAVLATGILLLASVTMAQDAHRVRLLGSANDFGGGGGQAYNDIWGYTAPDGREYAILGTTSGTAF